MSHKVVLYSKPDCSLCDEAKQMLEEIGHDFVVASDHRYDLRVPVIEIDDQIVTEGRASRRAVARALRR